MSSGIFGVALSGLNAAQIGMQTTGHNLSNVNTVGYSRQSVLQSQGAGQFTGAGFIGHGTNVSSIQRVYSDFLITQAQALQADAASSTTYATQLGQLSDLLSGADTSMSAALDGFFASVQSLSANPADPVSRQGLLSGAQSLAGRFQAMDSMLSGMQAQVDGQIRSSVDLINSYSQSVATLNGAISDAQGSGQPPNDLLDQRDALIAKMNKEVRTIVVPDGTINLFMSNGQPLVLGTSAQKLQVVRDNLDATKLALGVSNGGTMQMFRQSDITGGALGGMLAFRDQSLQTARNELGRLAMAFGAAFNAQHSLGVDRNGAAGGTFFNVPAPQVHGSSINTGSGNLAATVSDYSALTNSDYQVAYDGSNYVVTRLSDNVQTTYASLPQTLDGLTLSLASGVPATGDRFLVQPTRGGAANFSVAISNPAQIAAGAPIRTGAASANRGDGMVSAGTVDSRDPNLTQPVTLTFTAAGNFDVSGTGTGNPTGVAYTSGAAISYNGWTINISGSPRAGDVFTVVANSGATGDNRNAMELANLATKALIGGASASGAYAQLVSSTGVRAQDMNMAMKTQQSLLDSANQAIGSVSGVNMDEEAANLLRYQQAYQAAGKVIAVANTLFDSLLQAVQ
jgi:flagellar hook-associated protein 1 FlgK